MIVSKGTRLTVVHRRKGTMVVKATEDFCTEDLGFWPVVLDQDYLPGVVNEWVRGDRVPCRGAFIQAVEEAPDEPTD